MHNVCLQFSVTLKQLVMHYIMFLHHTRGRQGQANNCEVAKCHSRHNRYRSCPRGQMIFNATVTNRISRSTCHYYNGSSIDYSDPAGAFGYNDDILWVTNGCRADFMVCYTDEHQMTSLPTETTELSESISPSTHRFNFTFLSTPTATIKQSVTDHAPYNTTYSQEWHSSEQHRQGQSGLMTGLIVVSFLLVFVGFLILTIVLLRKRQRRQRLLENQKRYHCNEMKGRAPYEERTAECYYETISDENAYAQLESSEGNTSNYFVLEPERQYSTSVDAGALSDSKILETPQTDNTQTNELKAEKDDSNTYFVVEPQSNTPLDESISPTDNFSSKGNTALRGADLKSGLLNMSSEDTYSCTDDESIAVQSLPDNEYNVLHVKSKNMSCQRHYDTFKTVQHGGNVEENNEYSQNVIP